MKKTLNAIVKIDGEGNTSVQQLSGEFKPISIPQRYRLLIGYKTWLGKTIFFNLLTTQHSLTFTIILEAIYNVRKLPIDFIEKAIHTESKPLTLIIGERWRMRITKY